MNLLGRSLLMVTAALLLTALGFAQSDPAAEFHANGNGGVQTADLQFMREAAQDNSAKIDLAYLALKNSNNEQVKAFAQQVLVEYGKANTDLSDIARAQFVAGWTPEVSSKQQDTYDALSQLQGKAFDKAYMEAMLKSNKTDVSRLKQEATKGNNQSMIDWSRQMLATTENNLKEAQKLAPQVGVHSTLTSGEQQTLNAGKPVNAVSQGAH
jgi:putative membrane protein